MKRIVRIAGSFAIVLVAYWAYALVAVPLIEPPAGRHEGGSTGGGGGGIVEAEPDLRLKALESLFPVGAWERENPKILESDRVTLLMKEYQNMGLGRVEIRPCTLVFYGDASVRDPQQRHRQAVVLEAPDGAVLEFDQPFDLRSLKIGRLVGGQLNGRITIRSKGRSAGDEDDLWIVTRDVELTEQHVWTPHAVDFRLGPHYGRGRQMHIKLLQGKRSSKEGRHGPNIAGVELFEMKHVERLHLEAGRVPLPSETAPQDPPPAPEQSEELPLEITCKGPFRFDVLGKVATFRDHVDVIRLHPVGPVDQLNCELLSIFFAQREKTPPTGGNAGEAPAEETQQLGSLGLRPQRVEARGEPVTVLAPSEQLHAQARRIEYDLSRRRLVLDGESEVVLRQGRNEIHARNLEYQSAGPGRLGRIAARGPGWLRGQLAAAQASTGGAGSLPRAARREAKTGSPHETLRPVTPQDDPPDEQLTAKWGEMLRVYPHDENQVISLRGDPVLQYGGIGKLSAGEIHFWLLESPPGAAEDQPRLRPDRMLARENVLIGSPQLSGAVEQLEVWFGENGVRKVNSEGKGKESGGGGKASEDRSQEAGDRSQEAGDRRQEAGGRRQESGDRRQEAGDRSQESGGRRQEAGGRRDKAVIRGQGSGFRVQGSRLQGNAIPGNRPPPTAHRLPLTAHRLPPTAYRLPSTAHRPPPTAYRLPHTTHRPPPAAEESAAAELPRGHGERQQHFEIVGRLLQARVTVDGRQQTQLSELIVEDGARFIETQTAKADERPLAVSGDRLHVVDADKPHAAVTVTGRPARFEGRGLALTGTNINLNRGTNRLWVDGAGRMDVPIDRDLSGNALPNPATLNVQWQRRMAFDGRTAQFDESVTASTAEQQLKTETLEVRFQRPIRFAEAGMDEQPQVEQLLCRGGVFMQSRTADGRGQASFEQMQLVDLAVNLQSGAITAGGPGWLNSVRLGANNPAGRGGATPFSLAGVSRPAGDDKQLRCLHVRFQDSIGGNLHTQQIVFTGQVRTTYAPVDSWQAKLDVDDPDSLGPQGVVMHCQRLGVTQMPKPSGEGRALELLAEGNPVVEGSTFTARAIRMTYAEAKDLLVLEGDGRTDAELFRQQQTGGPTAKAAAQKIYYWPTTNRVKVEGAWSLELENFPIGNRD